MTAFWIGLLVGILLATFAHWWMMAFHDAKVINRALDKRWQAEMHWAERTKNPCPPPPDHLFAK